MGLKLALIMFVVMGVLGGVFYWYYNDTQEKMAILHENNAKLEIATATQTQAIESLEEDIVQAREITKRTEQEFAVAREQVDNLRDKWIMNNSISSFSFNKFSVMNFKDKFFKFIVN